MLNHNRTMTTILMIGSLIIDMMVDVRDLLLWQQPG